MPRDGEFGLYRALTASRQIAGLEGRLSTVQPYGVLVSLGHRPLGLWSVWGDQYVFRGLANYEPYRRCADLRGVHSQTVKLLTDCRRGWAEQFERRGEPLHNRRLLTGY